MTNGVLNCFFVMNAWHTRLSAESKLFYRCSKLQNLKIFAGKILAEAPNISKRSFQTCHTCLFIMLTRKPGLLTSHVHV